MAIAHATSGEPGLHPAFGSSPRDTPSHALVKGRDLEVIRLVLQAGKAMPPHEVSGEVTGAVPGGPHRVDRTPGRAHHTKPVTTSTLTPANLAGLRALEDASALVTISLAGAPGQPPHA